MSEDKCSEKGPEKEQEKERNKVVASVADALIGAVDFSAEHVSNAVNKLAERGKLTRDEAGKLAKDINKRGKKQRAKIQEKLGDALSRMRAVSQKQHDALMTRVEKLEKALKKAKAEEKPEDA